MSGRRYHGDGISGIRIAAYQIFIEKMELNLSRDFNPSSLPLNSLTIVVTKHSFYTKALLPKQTTVVYP